MTNLSDDIRADELHSESDAGAILDAFKDVSTLPLLNSHNPLDFVAYTLRMTTSYLILIFP